MPWRGLNQSMDDGILRRVLSPVPDDDDESYQSIHVRWAPDVMSQSYPSMSTAQVPPLLSYEDFKKAPDLVKGTLLFSRLVPRKREPSGDGSEPPQSSQTSLITIFTIWNTMMGTSLLSMPWGIREAGPIPAVVILIAMTSVTFYTAKLVLQSPRLLRSHYVVDEFTDVCNHRLGGWAKKLALTFSLIAFFGAMLVYWVLMSTFLKDTGNFVNQIAHGDTANITFWDKTVLCPENNKTITLFSERPTLYKTIWNAQTTPIFLAVLIFPLLFIDNLVFFAKFNSLGTISVMYLIGLCIAKIVAWDGFHIDKEELFRFHFFGAFKFSGILGLALFIHNAIITIMRNNRDQEKNVRDLGIGYILTASTYLGVGMLFFLAFPLQKSCIQDNILNNFESSDALIMVSRVFLLFQMATVFPLLAYLYRTNVLAAMFPDPPAPVPSPRSSFSSYRCNDTRDVDATSPDEEPLLGLWNIINREEKREKYKRLMYHAINVSILFSCIVVAIFYPKIGRLISIAGSLVAAVYIFFLPGLVYFAVASNAKRAMFIAFALFGFVNLVFQFLKS